MKALRWTAVALGRIGSALGWLALLYAIAAYAVASGQGCPLHMRPTILLGDGLYCVPALPIVLR